MLVVVRHIISNERFQFQIELIWNDCIIKNLKLISHNWVVRNPLLTVGPNKFEPYKKILENCCLFQLFSKGNKISLLEPFCVYPQLRLRYNAYIPHFPTSYYCVMCLLYTYILTQYIDYNQWLAPVGFILYIYNHKYYL